MRLELHKLSMYTRVGALVVGGAAILICSQCSAHCWDIHVETEVDERQYDSWKESNDKDRYDDISDRRDNGKEVSKSEEREAERYEVDHIN